jgi:SAM-dependent methyltransferase
MRRIGRYDIDDPAKIQGRDEVFSSDRSVAGIRLNYCLEALQRITGTVVLLGCGAGRYVRALKRSRPDLCIVGCDLSVSALREARRVDSESHYAALDASLLPFQDCSVQGVVFFDLVEHVPEHQRMLNEIQRILAPGGVLHFYTPLEDQPRSIYRLLASSDRIPLRTWKRDHVGHINFFTSTDVLRNVQDAGLRPARVAFGFHLFGQLHDLVDYWQRERAAGGSGRMPLKAVRLISRVIFLFTWRLSYFEDRLYDGSLFASGMHLSATRGDRTANE